MDEFKGYSGGTPPPFGGSPDRGRQESGFTMQPNGLKARNLEMLDACKMYWMNYAQFEGRSRRAEYWWAALMVFVIGIVCGAVAETLASLAGLAMLIPNLAVGVRRLHDIGKSGWNLLLGLIPIVGMIILIVWFCREGTIGPNEYGNDVKYVQ